MASLQVSGTIKHIGEHRKGTSQAGKDWETIEFVVSVNEDKYTNDHQFEFFGDKAQVMKHYNVGDEVTIDFNLGRCRQGKDGRWWNSSHGAWKIAKGDAVPAGGPPEDNDVPF